MDALIKRRISGVEVFGSFFFFWRGFIGDALIKRRVSGVEFILGGFCWRVFRCAVIKRRVSWVEVLGRVSLEGSWECSDQGMCSKS